MRKLLFVLFIDIVERRLPRSRGEMNLNL